MSAKERERGVKGRETSVEFKKSEVDFCRVKTGALALQQVRSAGRA